MRGEGGGGGGRGEGGGGRREGGGILKGHPWGSAEGRRGGGVGDWPQVGVTLICRIGDRQGVSAPYSHYMLLFLFSKHFYVY